VITQNIIGYTLSAQSGKTIHATDPLRQMTLPEAFSVATTEETNLAVQKAHQAWRNYRNTSGQDRAKFLDAIATGLESLGQALVDRVMLETAYPEVRVIVERNRTCAQLRMWAREAIEGKWKEITLDEALPNRAPTPRPELQMMMIPLGPVVVFGASNFPLAYSTAGGDVASALAAGCPVIVKAHDSHLGTNALVAEVIMEAARSTGMPDGVFSSINGDGFQTGRQLVTHPLTAAVGFTGSKAGGKALFDLGQQRPHPIPVFAEMGSVNPIFLLPAQVAADPAKLATQLVTSMTMTTGQFCTNPGVLVVLDSADTDILITALKTELEKVPPSTMLNSGILNTFHRGITTISQKESLIILKSDTSTDSSKVAPVLALTNASVFMDNPLLQEEIFGPYTIIVKCESLDEMRQVAYRIEGQLTATIHATKEEVLYTRLLVNILMEKVGRIIINGVPTGVEVCDAMTHGGPYPSSTDARFTAVGSHAIWRWLRPVTFQNFTDIGITIEQP